MNRVVSAGTVLALVLLSGCGRPDPEALQKLACEQAANSFDLNSVGQLDALRKALGVAPGLDPIGRCRALGVPMQSRPPGGGEADQSSSDPN